MSTMTSERKAELAQRIELHRRCPTSFDDAAVHELAATVAEILDALPVTDEREGRHKVGNPVCPKCFASHPPLLDCTLQFVANAAPVEGDEACVTQGQIDELEAICESLREGGWFKLHAGALQYLDPILAAVKAIVAKAPDAGLVEHLAAFVDIIDGTDQTGFTPTVEQMLMDLTEEVRPSLARYQQQEG